MRNLTGLNNERRLKLVDLSGTKVTDRFLIDLHKLDRVEVIDLRDTEVTDAGVHALRNALPKCKVVR